MHGLVLSVATVILLPEQDYGKRTDGLTEILRGIYVFIFTLTIKSEHLYVIPVFISPFPF